MKLIRIYGSIFATGFAMGAANVIPGVSGGTIAFITGIYERLIDAIKSFDLTAIRCLGGLRFKEFAAHTDFFFLAALGTGVAASFLSLAKLLEFLFAQHPVHIWAFFFGLILASIYYVGKMVKQWSVGPVVALLIGVVVAITIALLTPASENESFGYLVVCGVVAICSMIIPGLSGSFVLLLMGNYMLVIASISTLSDGLKELSFTEDLEHAIFKIMLPVGIGCVVGLMVFSHVLSWVFRRFHDVAVSLMAGFVAGSLLIIWPWKNELHLLDEAGELILRKGEPVIQGYAWFLPGIDGSTAIAVLVMLLGVAAVWLVEKLGAAGGD